ncbi:ICOS ligand isoform X2 [Hyperolius riggenbachi]|uniref:ICOS ligand isoform X2 n=1 Tax=Hyperolius riggenbachi TaxID=752182 RepID=UPI0035A39589
MTNSSSYGFWFHKMLFCLFLSVWGSAEALEGRLKGSVELPCKEPTQNYSLEKLLVYWQRPGGIVVAALVNGTLEDTNQSKEYKGRTSFNATDRRDGHFILHLSELSWADDGEYECYVIHTTSSSNSVKKHSMTLHVKAEFSTPSVINSRPGETSYGQEVTLTCQTQGGIEQPTIMWINTIERTPINDGQIHHSTNKEGDIFNATSMLTINVTSNINISCIILTPSRNFTSGTYVLKLDEGPDVEKQYGVSPAVPGTLVTLLVLAAVGALVMVRRHFCATSGWFPRAQYTQAATQIVTDHV